MSCCLHVCHRRDDFDMDALEGLGHQGKRSMLLKESTRVDEWFLLPLQSPRTPIEDPLPDRPTVGHLSPVSETEKYLKVPCT